MITWFANTVCLAKRVSHRTFRHGDCVLVCENARAFGLSAAAIWANFVDIHAYTLRGRSYCRTRIGDASSIGCATLADLSDILRCHRN